MNASVCVAALGATSASWGVTLWRTLISCFVPRDDEWG